MISMAPSSLTAGDSSPRATRSTAATMGPKRSSIAWMLDAGAWTLAGGWTLNARASGARGVGDFRPTAFRFTPRLSHARISRHGLHAPFRARAVLDGTPRLA